MNGTATVAMQAAAVSALGAGGATASPRAPGAWLEIMTATATCLMLALQGLPQTVAQAEDDSMLQ